MLRVLRWLGGGLLFLAACAVGLWVWGMPPGDLRGVWHKPEDGSWMTLSATRAVIYHENNVDCAPVMGFPAHLPLIRMAEGAVMSQPAPDQLRIDIEATLEPWIFARADALPQSCTEDLPPTPANVFNTMWAAMDENYAFFDLHGLDWDAVRDMAPGPDARLSDADLFALMSEAVSGTDDGHIQLVAQGVGGFSPEPGPTWLTQTGLELNTVFDLALETASMDAFGFDRAPVIYGLREDGIGYINISGMWIDSGLFQSELSTAHDVIAKVASDLAGARALIVDVRHNGGGSDGVSLAYASVFTQAEQVVLTKRTRDGDGWTDPVDGALRPHPGGFYLGQPVILLTSDVTASAAEIFTIAMGELPQVTVMGEPTGGGLSDILSVTLPNGWGFGLSNQEYRTVAGALYEKVGVPVDIPFPMDGAALAAGQDRLLEAAITRLTQ